MTEKLSEERLRLVLSELMPHNEAAVLGHIATLESALAEAERERDANALKAWAYDFIDGGRMDLMPVRNPDGEFAHFELSADRLCVEGKTLGDAAAVAATREDGR